MDFAKEEAKRILATAYQFLKITEAPRQGWVNGIERQQISSDISAPWSAGKTNRLFLEVACGAGAPHKRMLISRACTVLRQWLFPNCLNSPSLVKSKLLSVRAHFPLGVAGVLEGRADITTLWVMDSKGTLMASALLDGVMFHQSGLDQCGWGNSHNDQTQLGILKKQLVLVLEMPGEKAPETQEAAPELEVGPTEDAEPVSGGELDSLIDNLLP